ALATAALRLLGGDLLGGRAAARFRLATTLGRSVAALLHAGAAALVLGAAGHRLGAAGQLGRGLAARLVLGAAGQLLGAAVGLLLGGVLTGEHQAERQEQSGEEFQHSYLVEKGFLRTGFTCPWPCSRPSTQHQRGGKNASCDRAKGVRVRDLTDPEAVEERQRRREEMKALVESACGVRKGEGRSRGARRGNQAKFNLELLSVRAGEGVGLGAARLEGLGRLRRRGCRLLLQGVQAAAAVSELGGGLV